MQQNAYFNVAFIPRIEILKLIIIKSHQLTLYNEVYFIPTGQHLFEKPWA